MNSNFIKNIEDIEENEDFIRRLFENRENTESVLTQKFKDELKETKEEVNLAYEKLRTSILKYIKDDDLVGEVLKVLNRYKEKRSCLESYFNEQYYTFGFKDAIKLILQSLK